METNKIMDTRRAMQLTNVPGRQKRFTLETPGGDIVMVCYSLERRHYKIGTSFWPTHRPKFLETLEQMCSVDSISRMIDGEDAAVISCTSLSIWDYVSIQEDIRELVEATLK